MFNNFKILMRIFFKEFIKVFKEKYIAIYTLTLLFTFPGGSRWVQLFTAFTWVISVILVMSKNYISSCTKESTKDLERQIISSPLDENILRESLSGSGNLDLDLDRLIPDRSENLGNKKE